MARFYSNENLALQVVIELRRLGHDVLTSVEVPDIEVLAFAAGEGRIVDALRRASEAATDRSTMGRLMDAAKEEAARCHPVGGDRCEDLLFQKPTDK